MNNAKQIAEKMLESDKNNMSIPYTKSIELARAYLDAAKELETTKAALSELDIDLRKAYVDESIKNDALKSEITELKEENEKLKKSRDALRKAVEFYGDINNWKDVSSINESSFKYFYCLRQRTKDFEALNEKYHFYAGKKAREAMQADNEIFADKV